MASTTGKSITTSVPTISIKFHANDEQLEELYGSDDEQKSLINEKKLCAASKEKGSNSTGNIQDTTEGSPLKYLKLNKRSNSTDVTTITDSSPQSDPWKFFSDITGKIAKSVEDKITEIKARNQEEGSPGKGKPEGKTDKDTKENLNLSDSEDLSESSLSRTCGIVSTTEGAEMSSDEDSHSIKNETPTNIKLHRSSSSPEPPNSMQKFRVLKSSKDGYSTLKEGTVSMSSLTKIYNINVDDAKQALPEYNDDVESGVDALEDAETEKVSMKAASKSCSSKAEILSALEKNIENIEVDGDGTLNIKEVTDFRWRGDSDQDDNSEVQSVFAPRGFVDFRYRIQKANSNFLFSALVLSLSILYLLILTYSTYIAGMIAGIFVTSLSYFIMNRIRPVNYPKPQRRDHFKYPTADRWEFPTIKEYQPMLKYEGWVNEYPDHYDPETYHIRLTQPVYLKLEENWLRISNTTSKVPKRAMHNEGEIKKNFKHKRIYNLIGAKISLLPVGLAKIRHWSKKYPICITLSKDQFKFEDDLAPRDTDEEKENSPPFAKKTTGFNFKGKTSTSPSPQRYSKLFAEQDNFYTDAESISDTSSPIQEEEKPLSDELEKNLESGDLEEQTDDSWVNCTLDESPTETKIYLFGRTDREKEDWFRRFTIATHPQRSKKVSLETECDLKKAASLHCSESILKDSDYSLYMSSILKAFKKREEEASNVLTGDTIEITSVAWINAFLGRIIFDCLCDAVFISKVQDRIQRKLASIKLPYFIEELSITELNMGKTSPLFKKISRPIVDDRGLWFDMAMTYEGSTVLTLMTKLNLMKLKHPHSEGKEVENRSAIFHSDVDDSAESSSDEESLLFPNMSEGSGSSSGPVAPLNKSKKIMKMVDRIKDSKLFQAATENKFIKRAMEGVSNTDLRLKVEIRAIEGTVVVNIPPPPTDRIWIGFKPVPVLSLSAHPIVGEKNINLMPVTSWIEKKLIQEFEKLLVLPNMEDLLIPIMTSKLPD